MVVKSQGRAALCDPKVTPMNGVAILPLIDIPEFPSWTRNGTQVDGSLESLQNFLDKFNEHGGALA